MNLSVNLSAALTLACTGLAVPLAGQSLQEAFTYVPQDVTRVDVTGNWVGSRARLEAAVRRIKIPSPPYEVVEGLNLDPALLAHGPVVTGAFKGKDALGTREATWVPVKDFQAMVKQLRAVKKGATYRVVRKTGTFTCLKCGHFALISKHAELVVPLGKRTGNLASAMAPLVPWIAAHDVVIVATEASTRTALAAAQASLANDTGQTSQLKILRTVLGPTLGSIAASVRQAALALDFPEDGSFRFTARAFFTPASPLATRGAELPPAQGNPMEGLAPAGFVLAAGGPLPAGLSDLVSAFVPIAMGDTAESHKLAGIQAELFKNIRSEGMVFGLPSGPGAPLLGNIKWLLKVEDVPKYFQNEADLAEAQRPMLETTGFQATLEKDILPGVPSSTRSMSFGTATAQAPGMPPVGQLKMFMGMLFGNPDRFQMSSAQLDEHTVVGVIGDAKALQAAMGSFGPGFASDPGVAAIDARLTPRAPWRFYLHLGNLRDFVQAAMTSLAPGKPLPVLPPCPPLGATVAMDAQGVELSASASPESLDALGVLFGAFEAKPQKD